MNKTKIELQVANIIIGPNHAEYSNLTLKELTGDRELTICIGTSEAQSIIVEMKGIYPSRPLTHQLFAGVLEAMAVQLLRVLIYKVENGIYYSYIYLKTNNATMRTDARTSDAVALALRMRAPIFIYEDILNETQLNLNQLTELGEKALRKENINQLRSALQQAIETENYEAAARLRDAINEHDKHL